MRKPHAGPRTCIVKTYDTRVKCLLLLLLAGGIFGCGRVPRPKNVLVITIDTLRADHLGCYGYTLARTANIDRLAAEGVRASDVITAAPITLPSHSTIFTGLYPPAHGVRDNGAYSLGDEATTLAERLKAQGFTTHAFISALVLNRRYGLGQGFETYDDDLYAEDSPKLFMIRDRSSARTADRLLAWLEGWGKEPARRPFFTWVHFFDPHQPYAAPLGDRILAPHPYDGEIAAVDRAVGRIVAGLKAQGILDDTLIVLTADHGESLGEHEEKTHAIFIYDATLRVPLILRYPGALGAGQVFDGPVATADIAPTVLALLGLEGGDEMQGQNLMPALGGNSRSLDGRVRYAESRTAELGFGMAPLFGLRQDGFQWIRAPRPELYDLKKDPNQLGNLAAAETDRAQAMDRELDRFFAASARSAVASPKNPMDQETVEMLQSLGYIARANDRAAVTGMDPKDGIAIYNLLEDARHLAQRGRLAAAEGLLQEILARIPGHVSALNILGFVSWKQGRIEQAEDAYRRSLAVDPHQARVYNMLGAIAVSQDDLAAADGYLHRTLEESPLFVEAMANLGVVAALGGDDVAAREWFEKAMAADPAYPHAYRRLADLYYERGEWAKAREFYDKTLTRLPNEFNAMVQAGSAARRLGEADAARDYFARAAKLRPDSWIPSYNLACLEAISGQTDAALVALEGAVAKGFSDDALLAADPDLATLRQRPEFRHFADEVSARSEPALAPPG